MNKRVLLMGMALWLALLGLGIKWATNPMARPPGTNLGRITLAQTEQSFPIRLTSLPTGEPGAVSHVRAAEQALDEDKIPTPISFNYEEWAFRELRTRLITFFVLWIVGGFLMHWLGRRLLENLAD